MTLEPLTAYQQLIIGRAGWYAARDIAVPIDLEAALSAEGLLPINDPIYQTEEYHG